MKNSGMTALEKEKLVREAYDNFPEASMSLVCVGWKYEEFKFTFIDEEENKKHIVRLKDAMKGLDLFMASVSRGELPGLGLPADYLKDTGSWDADAFDALNQMAIFGEVIYG